MGGEGCVPACRDHFAFGCCSGNNCSGEGVEMRSVDDVTHLVLGLKMEECGQCSVQAHFSQHSFHQTLVMSDCLPHLGSCCPPSPAEGGQSHWNI